MRGKKELFVTKFFALIISLILFFGNLGIYAQRLGINQQFKQAVDEYTKADYNKTIIKLKKLIKKIPKENTFLFGRYYLLLGASYENLNKIDIAKQYYRNAKECLPEKYTLKEVSLKELEYYREVFNVKEEKDEGVIEKPGKQKKKKKFPWLLVIGRAVAAGIIIYLLFNKGNDEKQQPTKGSIKLESSPGEAEIWLDRNDTGKKTTSILSNINPGSHDILLKKENYFYYRETVNVTAGKQTTVSANLEELNLSIDWAKVPAGEFKMGDNFNEGYSRERPVHTVYLDEYYISKYEITHEYFIKFLNDVKVDSDGFYRGHSMIILGDSYCAIDYRDGNFYFKGSFDAPKENCPVINVNWYGAKEFCKGLSDKTGKNIHLPTEAQWEKGARGTDQRKYPWGNYTPDCSIANYTGCIDGGRTRVVDCCPGGQSSYGVYNMAGNSWEWCSDWYDGNYYSYSPTDNPSEPDSGVYKVFRGGNYDYNHSSLRSAKRNLTTSDSYGFTIGFRVCLSH